MSTLFDVPIMPGLGGLQLTSFSNLAQEAAKPAPTVTVTQSEQQKLELGLPTAVKAALLAYIIPLTAMTGLTAVYLFKSIEREPKTFWKVIASVAGVSNAFGALMGALTVLGIFALPTKELKS